MDANTQILVDKIKRGTTTVFASDSAVTDAIGDCFDKLCSDTGIPLLSFGTDSVIVPTEFFIGSDNSDIREALYLCTLLNLTEVKSEAAQTKAVIVRSGRDMVDTTKSAKGFDTLYERRLKKYQDKCNDIKNRFGGAKASISDQRWPFGYPNMFYPTDFPGTNG